MIRFLPVSMQVHLYRWKYGRSLRAIKELRHTTKLPLKTAKELIMGDNK